MRILLEKLGTVSLSAALVGLLVCSPVSQVLGQSSSTKSQAVAAQKQAAAGQPAEKQSKTARSVQKDVEKQAAAKHKQEEETLVAEAIEAVKLTQQVLDELNAGKKEDALKTLEKAIGKIELAVALNPNVAFLPVSVESRVYDLWATVEAVEKRLKQVQQAFEKGQIQVARRTLWPLASEVVVSTTKLPVALYPQAIKKVAPLIRAGKIEEAKEQLQLALNLLVVTETVYPLPVLRANVMLAEAEKLAEKPNRSDKENKRLEELLKEVEHQIRLGRVLGYLDPDRAEKMLHEAKQIRNRTQGGKSGKGFFDRIKELFRNWGIWSDNESRASKR